MDEIKGKINQMNLFKHLGIFEVKSEKNSLNFF